MDAEQEAYVRRIKEAGLLDEYQEILDVINEGMSLEAKEPEKAAKLYLKAFDLVEATGAVAGASDHPLIGTRGTLLNFLGELTQRGVKWSSKK